MIWEKLTFFSFIHHPAAGWFKGGNEQKAKPKPRRNSMSVESPDSVHLRGAFKKDGQRKNPAP